jgi:hypothetical protein
MRINLKGREAPLGGGNESIKINLICQIYKTRLLKA